MSEACKILIVEDELITRQALRYIIGMQQEQFVIVGEAHNGKDALELIEAERPHIIISDVVMPMMDGVELAKIVNLKYPEIYTIMLSGHSEFTYVKAAFQYGVADYILKPQLEPQALLEKLSRLAQKQDPGFASCRENDSADLLKDLLAGQTEHDTLPPGHYCLWCCNLKPITNGRLHNENNAKELITDIADRVLAAHRHYGVLTQDAYLVFLTCFSPGEYRQTVELLCLATEEIGQIIPSLFWTIGVAYQNEKETHQRFIDVRRLSDLKFYFGDERVILQQNLQEVDVHACFESKKYFESIRRMDFKAAFFQIGNFLCSLKNGRYLREQELKKLLEHTIYNTVSVLEELGVSIEELDERKMAFFSAIGSATRPEELVELMRDILSEIEEYTLQRRREDAVFQRILTYIADHFQEQITLNQLAGEFHLSYSYLSSCFQVFAGCGFNDYLNQIRVEEAKKLLTNSHIPLMSISERVGYSDQSYFGKVFKKRTGISPSAYRKLGTVDKETL